MSLWPRRAASPSGVHQPPSLEASPLASLLSGVGVRVRSGRCVREVRAAGQGPRAPCIAPVGEELRRLDEDGGDSGQVVPPDGLHGVVVAIGASCAGARAGRHVPCAPQAVQQLTDSRRFMSVSCCGEVRSSSTAMASRP